MTHLLRSLWLLLTALLPTGVRATPPADPAASVVIERYIRAVGGTAALEAVTTQVTGGTFDNGRGLVEPFVMYVRRPDQRVTVIGRRSIHDGDGSGRGYDGRISWDKNFIGTGLRTITGPELDDLARNADLFRPAHLADTCRSATLESSTSGATTDVVRCELTDRVERWSFDRTSGLLLRLETATNGDRVMVTHFEDYRTANGILTPFRQRVVTPGPTIVYTAATISYNQPIDERMFQQPAR